MCASECIFPLLEIKAAFAFTMRAFILLGSARSREANAVDIGQTGLTGRNVAAFTLSNTTDRVCIKFEIEFAGSDN